VFIKGTEEAMVLIALGMGYFVLYFAKREEKANRILGYAIGCGIIFFCCLLLLKNILLFSFDFQGMQLQRRLQQRMIYPPSMHK
jgi:Na+/phosphate symporter